jgi:ubiquinone/menaquinone biosynthesis C-methylase UbiE
LAECGLVHATVEVNLDPMLGRLHDLVSALRLIRAPAPSLYDALARRYDRMHQRWLRRGGEALVALQGSLLAELRPGLRVFDVGCGTGALAHWLAAVEPGVALTLVDAAPAMLARAAVADARRVRGDAHRLPFRDASFDVVLCAWVLETLDNPLAALDESLRVLAPGGLLCLCFCSVPRDRLARLRTLAVRVAVERVFRGRFLSPQFPLPSPSGLSGTSARQAHFRRLYARTQLATFALCRMG